MKRTIFFLTVIFFTILFIKCSENKKNKRIRIGELTVEGDISKDTILNGLITFYNSHNIIISKAHFANGIKDGDSINFYLNGAKKNEIIFFHGKENGYNYEFDSASGNIIYQGYYYFGRLMGPNFWYYPDKKIKNYNFTDFEGRTIFYAAYDSVGNVIQSSDQNQFFPINIAPVDANNIKQSFFFIYNLQPPNFKFSYKLCVEDSLKKISEPLDSIPNRSIYYEKLLPPLKNKSRYCVVLNITDSINKKNRTLIREIIN